MNHQKILTIVCAVTLVISPAHAGLQPVIAAERVEAESLEMQWAMAGTLAADMDVQAEPLPMPPDAGAGTQVAVFDLFAPLEEPTGAEPLGNEAEGSAVATAAGDDENQQPDAEGINRPVIAWASLKDMNPAQFFALTDGATTTFALATELGKEKNPLIGNSILGVLVVTALKYRLGDYIAKRPEPERSQGLGILSGLWGGATANNLLVIAQVASPVPILVGLAAGLWLWATSTQLQVN